VIIYECLHGERPFAGGTYQELIRSMSNELVLDSREPFAKFFERGLAQKPEKRFSSAGKMKYNLSNLALNSTE
jgi:serine/threonine protein kinase